MKRFGILLLLAALMLSLFSGCAAESAAPAQTEASPTVPAPVTEPQSSAAEANDDRPKLQFTTTDLNGETVQTSDFADAKVILINLWEPWCGPCVRELPYLAKLYENYKDQGLVVLGVFNDMEENAKILVEDNKVGYPILHFCSDFQSLTTDYVPTTVLVAGDGTLLTDEPLIGSRDYESWEAVILPYLEG